MQYSGYATQESTENHFYNFQKQQPSVLGKTNLKVSQAGMGMYRMADGQTEHKNALIAAIQSGINIIDTSSNYADGESEILLGKVLQEHFDSGGEREGIVLVSKAGYMQGQILEMSHKRESLGDGYQDLVMLDESLQHCIHPEFLEDCLSTSLERIGVKTLDVYLLHNPEYYLMWAEKNGEDLEESRTILYDRIQKAFKYLQDQVNKGRIRYFGISSNTLGYGSDHPQYVDLSQIIECAEQLPGFAVIQTPLNLLETGFMTQPNSGDYTAYQIAKISNLGILINRPLNALYLNQIQRLISLDTEIEPEIEHVSELVATLEAKESLFFEMPSIQNMKEEQVNQLKVLFNLGEIFQSYWQQCQGYEHWKDLMAQFFFPQVEHGVAFLQSELPEDREVALWLQGYLQRFADTSQHITAWYKCQGKGFRNELIQKIHSIKEDWKEEERLEKLAIRIIRSSESISSVLVGMRMVDYVGSVITEISGGDFEVIDEEWKQWARESDFSASF